MKHSNLGRLVSATTLHFDTFPPDGQNNSDVLRKQNLHCGVTCAVRKLMTTLTSDDSLTF